MKILFQFIHYDSENCKYQIDEQVSTFSKDIMHRIRKKAIMHLDKNPSDIVLATGYFFPTMVTYKMTYEPFVRNLVVKKLSCDLP